MPDLGNDIQIGNFKHLIEWLKTKVHSQGSRFSTPDLLKHATGQTLDVAIYKKHLETRYLG
jgi:carboxypeptidase Taq